ncbi:solute carrier family 23 member 1-like isoform X2 [Rhinatrema bivittatum]|uniref:solute carrier family 23 member 1-like isoform X2 n=1 Tax=Rhinatrema bivittatum TaxID=194408 RepID=UPI00112784D1|nr:solute carrier family 23 member 1-like isoform X2 [Rhinatrema bivittatum]
MCFCAPLSSEKMDPCGKQKEKTKNKNRESPLESTEEKADSQPSIELIYSINDRPPWYLCILLGLQHYILAFGGIIAIPLILAEPLCIQHDNFIKSQLISTIFFVSGLCTILQTTVGTRLPILQGGTFSFITPTLAILSLPQWKCPKIDGISPNITGAQELDNSETWKLRIREVQGAIIVASLLQVLLGFSGLIGLLLRFIGPLSIAPTVTLIGLSLFIETGKKSGVHWGITAMTIGLIILFSQYLRNIDFPLITYTRGKWKVIKYPVFKLFPVLLGMGISWLICYLLTYFNAFPLSPGEYGYTARTDVNLDAITNAPWFYIPYPGQWGIPTVSVSSVLGMLSGVLASTIESIGDYYACARLSGAPTPPIHALNRGIGMEGIGCILAGIWGTGNGTTSYSQNIAALGITKVGSRLVLQTAGFLLIVLGLFGKFGAAFITIPEPVIGGMFMVMFGMIAAVGISNLQHVDLNSSRNLFILGFSTFSGLVIPTWLKYNPGVINTGLTEADQAITVLLTTYMFVGGFFGCILDNTISATDEERGLSAWHKQMHQGSTSDNTEHSCYDLPCVTQWLRKLAWTQYIPFLPTFQMKKDKTNENAKL